MPFGCEGESGDRGSLRGQSPPQSQAEPMADAFREMRCWPSSTPAHPPCWGTVGPTLGSHIPLWALGRELGVEVRDGRQQGRPLYWGGLEQGLEYSLSDGPREPGCPRPAKTASGWNGFWVPRPRRRLIFLINSEALKQGMRLEWARPAGVEEVFSSTASLHPTDQPHSSADPMWPPFLKWPLQPFKAQLQSSVTLWWKAKAVKSDRPRSKS